jgi:hypothetical protein
MPKKLKERKKMGLCSIIIFKEMPQVISLLVPSLKGFNPS